MNLSKGVQTRNANPSKEYKYAWINRQRSMRSVSYWTLARHIHTCSTNPHAHINKYM